MNSVERRQALPQGWVWVTLGEMADIVRGVSFPKNARKLEPQAGHVACLRTANVQREVEWGDLWFVPEEYIKLESRYVQPLDVLISVSNSLELVGKVAQVTKPPQKSTLGAFISLLRFSSSLDAKFYYYQMASLEVQEEIRYSASTTTNISNISSSKLSGITLKIPPLPEQHRIVAEIEKQFTRLDASAAALKRAQANLKRYRASVLKSACEGRLVPTEAELARSEGRDYEPADLHLERILSERRAQWESQKKRRGKYKEPVAPDTTNLPDLPEGWVWATWSQLSGRVTVGHVGPMKHEYVDAGVPFLRSQNVRANRFDSEGIKYVSPAFHKRLSKSTLRPGDLLVVRSGSVGVTCVVPTSLTEANCADLVIVKRPKGIEPHYASYYMNSIGAKGIVRSGQVGVALIHFNTKSVESMPIPLPPLAEQRRIVAEVDRRLSVIQQAEAAVDAGLKRVERLRQSILKQAFSGKLVPQDPNDEPASVLLERIQAEREAAEAAAKAQRKPRRRRSKSAQANME